MLAKMLPKKENNDLFYQLALTMIDGIGAKSALALLRHFGNAPEIFKASLRELKAVEGLGEHRARAIKNHDTFDQATKEMMFLEQHQVAALFLDDPRYPLRLKQCADAPVLVYYKGTADLNASKILAVIGSRKNTEYGDKLCEELIESLKSVSGVVVVSGLAHGIDGIAHRLSLKNSIPTIGVLGHGLDMLYPPSHRSMAQEMQAAGNGGLLTEFPSGTKLSPSNFPVRNRLVAGMCDATVVVESNEKGGAMITAFMAASYNREVAAFPGRVSDTRSAGPLKLIRLQIASLIRSGQDLLELMSWQETPKKKISQPKLFVSLSEEEQKVVDVLTDQEAVHTDELMLQTGLSSAMLASVLLQLEMQDLVKSLPGKRYRL